MRLLLSLIAFVGLSTSGAAQSSGQYLITLMNGGRMVRMLPPDWTPRFEKAFLYLTPRDRLFVADVASIQPLHPDNIQGMRPVKLLLRSHLGRGSETFWVPNIYRKLDEAPHEEGFLVLGPQTLVREGIYREVLE